LNDGHGISFGDTIAMAGGLARERKTVALLAAKVRGKRLDCQQVLPPTFWIAERILQLRCIGLRSLH
jgi:hypothetical protein